MKKTCLILAAILLLLLAPGANAWRWATHSAVARAAYEELPENIKIHLDYNRIVEDGAIWPDKYNDTLDPYGRTFPGHFQPQSRNWAVYWLAEAKNCYEDGDYDNASLYLGIASHYIADSTALVHCGVHSYDNPGWALHTEFEQQGWYLSPARPSAISGFDLRQKLAEFQSGASVMWQQWLGSRHQSIVQEGVDLAASYTYNAWCQALGVPLPEAQGVGSSMDFRLIAGVALVILIVIMAVGMKRFYRE